MLSISVNLFYLTLFIQILFISISMSFVILLVDILFFSISVTLLHLALSGFWLKTLQKILQTIQKQETDKATCLYFECFEWDEEQKRGKSSGPLHLPQSTGQAYAGEKGTGTMCVESEIKIFVCTDF